MIKKTDAELSEFEKYEMIMEELISKRNEIFWAVKKDSIGRMNLSKEHAQKISPDLFKRMLKSGNVKKIGRDTTKSWFAYENFEEYYTTVWSSVSFTYHRKIKSLWMTLLRDYFIAQLKAPIENFNWNREEVEQFVEELVKENVDIYIGYLESPKREGMIKDIERRFEESEKLNSYERFED